MNLVEQICAVCGNDIDRPLLCCPYCGSRLESGQGKKAFSHRVVNLEQGHPLLEVALKRMRHAIADSAKNGVSALTMIHGYGSSGRGGVIRRECRKELDFMAAKGEISGYLAGEEFYRHYPAAKGWLRRYPKLAENSHLNRKNPGVTLVFL